jgi:leader peptidase (prepilin peptidase)/N-methyltransferase
MVIISIILLGWIAGWLVNYLSDVLPVTRRFSQPTCPNCQTPFPWKDYLLLGNCRGCGRKRGARTLTVQAVLTVAPVLLWIFPRQHFPFALAFLLLVYLAIVMVIDIEHRLVLHPVSLAGALLGFGMGLFLHGLLPTLIGGAAGFGVMWVFYYAGGWYVRWMAKRRGLSTDEVALGFGDVNLSGILGLLLGWPSIVLGLFLAIVIGGVVSLGIILGTLALKRYRAFTAIPYAPFLVLSALLLYLH